VAGADLHLHSTVSDGRFTPREVMRRAFGCDLSVVALTDHDTVAGLAEAQREARRLGLELLPGCELSVMAGGIDVHVLAYGIDAAHPGLHRLLAALRAGREERVRTMVVRLADLGVKLRLDEVLAEARGSHALGRGHVARALCRRGWVASPRAAFQAYIGDGRPACVPKRTPAPAEVLRVVRAAGGAPVIAHPLLYGLADPEAFFADWDIAGVEVDHPAHPRLAHADLAGWVARRRLIATAGSDWHGEEEPDAYIGCRRCDPSVGARLRAAGGEGGAARGGTGG